MKLICPICGNPLSRVNNTAVCPQGHSFDYAASGYLNLNRRQGSAHGDDEQMIKARTRFLASRHYAFLRSALQDTVNSLKPACLADLGCGEGYYTGVLNAEEKYGFDLSKTALIHAAKHDHSTQYVLASIFRLPLPDHCLDTALTCFAPCAEDEILRLLKTDGSFIQVTPGRDHLFELKEVLYDTPYRNRTDNTLQKLTITDENVIRSTFTCTQEELNDLFRMTPYAWRTGQEGKKKLQEVSSLQLTAEFIIRTFKR